MSDLFATAEIDYQADVRAQQGKQWPCRLSKGGSDRELAEEIRSFISVTSCSITENDVVRRFLLNPYWRIILLTDLNSRGSGLSRHTMRQTFIILPPDREVQSPVLPMTQAAHNSRIKNIDSAVSYFIFSRWLESTCHTLFQSITAFIHQKT